MKKIKEGDKIILTGKVKRILDSKGMIDVEIAGSEKKSGVRIEISKVRKIGFLESIFKI